MSLDPYGRCHAHADHTTKSDVGSVEGTTWSLSSAKARHGVAQLMDDDLDTLWQSDGAQPHSINIHFPKRTAVTVGACLMQLVSIYLDCQRDDSYTPTKILINAGTHPYDLVEVRYREFVEPQGWYHFVLDQHSPDTPEEEHVAYPLHPIEVFVLQVCILGNHLNGKDTHIRCMKVFGPPAQETPSVGRPAPKAPVQRLVQQGMRTDAFQRQVARVGYERATAQLQRIMRQHAQSSSRPALVGPRGFSTRALMEAILRKQLKQWQREFRAQHAREPSKSDIQRNPEIASTYDTWRALSEATSKQPKCKGSASSMRGHDTNLCAPPTTPKKLKKKVPAPSPENPFRSPQKTSPSYSKAVGFPSAVVPETETRYESDMSDEEVPEELHRTPSKPHPAPAPRPGPTVALFTPRTKARKRLRGEDIRTPPSARLQRTDSHARSALIANSPQAKRRIFSAPQASREDTIPTRRDGDDDDEILGPSPQKSIGKERNFRPFFRIPSSYEAPRSPECSPEQPSVSSQASYATLSPTPGTTQTSATTQGPPVAPGAQMLELDDPAAPPIQVLPYQRFGSARRTVQDDWDDMDALQYTTAPTREPSTTPSPVQYMEGLSLLSPSRHTHRAHSARRQRNEQLANALFHETHDAAPIHARADVDPDDTLCAALSDDDWASEASEGAYGLGDGEMDKVDIL